MTISYDWYTTNYRHTAVYATLIVKATVYNEPFTFNWSYKKIGRPYFLKFPRQFHIFRDAGTKYRNPGLSRPILDVWHVLLKLVTSVRVQI